MATATLMYPFAEMRGTLLHCDRVYSRMVHGKCILQHKPQMKSPKRIAACQAFGAKYGTARKKQDSS